MAKQLSLFQCFGGARSDKASDSKEKQASKREGDHIYDQTKRKRTFQPSWKIGRNWLKFDEEKDVIFCETCRLNKYHLADTACQFAKGSTSLQITSVNKHEGSTKHRREQAAHDAANTPANLLPADQMLAKMNADVHRQLCAKFRNAHALAKHHRPYTDYVWMNKLDRLKGIDVGSETLYASDKCAAIFTHHIAEVEKERVKKEVAEADFASLIMDGSTDVSVMEQEMVYVRTCVAGVVDVQFIGIVGTPKADADGITKSLTKAVLNGLGINMTDMGKKLVAMGTDGAAVMLGCNNGVVTKVRDMVAPSLVGVHCFAHRLELAAKDVVKKHAQYGIFEKLMQNLFKFYKMSNLNRSNLKEACKTANVKQLVPTRLGGTRWVPHTLRAINNLWQIYPALVLHLSQVKLDGQSEDAKAKASGFHEKLTLKSTVEFGHFLWDILITLARLSLFLQARKCSVAEVADQLDAQIAVLETYSDQCGPKLQKVRGVDQLDGVALKDDRGRFAHATIEDITGNVCRDLISSLTVRFDMDDAIIAATSLANKKTWPMKIEDATHFGNDNIVVLLHHFKANLKHADIDVDCIPPEWTMLKRVLYKRHPDDIQSMSWAAINRQYRTDIAPNFLRLIDLILTIPATSAEAERGFSALKLLKTDTRNRLQEDSLNTLLRIVLLSPTEQEFDPSPAVQHWFNATTRRKERNMEEFKEDEGVDDSELIESDDSDTDNDIPLVGLLKDSNKD